MKLRYLFWLLIAFFYYAPNLQALPYPGAFDQKNLKWLSIQTQHFNIHFHTSAKPLALRLSHISEKIHKELSEKYNWKPFGRTEVVIADITDLSNGHALVMPYNYILLYPYPPATGQGLDSLNDWLADLFRHEYTHILHIDKHGGLTRPLRWILGTVIAPNGLTPAWVREGIAVYEESAHGHGRANSTYSAMILRTALLENRFLKIDQLNGDLLSWPGGLPPYIYGGEFWKFLGKRYGAHKVQEFIERYGNSIWIYSLNNKARKVFGKNFLKLYSEWKASLEKKYHKQVQDKKKLGLTLLKNMAISGDLSSLAYNKYLDEIYVFQQRDKSRSRLLRLSKKKSKSEGLTEELRVKYKPTHMTFAADGKSLIFSALALKKSLNLSQGSSLPIHYSSDLYQYSFINKKIKKLTEGQRASSPVQHPKKEIIYYIKNQNATSQIYQLDLKTSISTQVSNFPDWTIANDLALSPNGQTLAASLKNNNLKNNNQNRSIWLIDTQNFKRKRITQAATSFDPFFDPYRPYLYFTSDLDGIFNIYRYHLKSQHIEQVTNILSGVFRPIVDRKDLYVLHYNNQGYALKNLALNKIKVIKKFKSRRQAKVLVDKVSINKNSDNNNTANINIKKYSPFPKVLIPRYLMPTLSFVDGNVFTSVSTGSMDPLLKHSWAAALTYRSDANYLGYQFTYQYSGFKPYLGISYFDLVASYGDLYGTGNDFFEKRRRAVFSLKYPKNKHQFSSYYFFENRSLETGIPNTASSAPNQGRFAGLGFKYNYNNSIKYKGKISPESGPVIKLDLEMSNSILGSSHHNERVIASGDIRYFLKMPYHKDHIFALRGVFGFSWGDDFFQGTFRLGSALGESSFTSSSTRLFPLRGLPQVTFSGDNALLFSAEYRLPLFKVERGLGTLPFYLSQAHLAFFSDFGTVWDNDLDIDNFLLGIGIELRANFMLSYGIPLTARLGYGIIVKGRNFIEGLEDPLTGSSLKNGTLIFQLGTSF